jgi:hypothetical protein
MVSWARPRASLPELLKFHLPYRAAFDARLDALLRASSASPTGPWPLTQESLLARFDAHAGEFRRTFECEAMRWGDHYNRRNVPFPNIVHTLPGVWANNLQEIRFATDEPPAPMLRTRRNLKELARESRLLNDIPPPLVTVVGTDVVATRTTGTGRVYIEVESFAQDPKLVEPFPEYSPPEDSSASKPFQSSDKFVTARIFGPDLDGELGWSAATVVKINE